MQPGGEALYRLFASHRSIRRFRRQGIPGEHVRLLMEAARRAPTDASLHLWSAVRVTDDGLRRRISDLIGQEHVYEAGEFFVFIADLYRVTRLAEKAGLEPGDFGLALFIFAIIDASLAAENMALMAESLGYGTCFIGGIQSAAGEIIELLSLPERTYPLFGLAIGFPLESPPVRPRLPGSLLFHENGYREYGDDELERALTSLDMGESRNRLPRILKRYVARGGIFEARNKEVPVLLARQGLLPPSPE